MTKYIIKNCPAFNKFTRQCRGAYSKDIEYQYCSGNESCVTKQIVQTCKTQIKFCQNCSKNTKIGTCCESCIESGETSFARRILSKLEIEEVE